MFLLEGSGTEANEAAIKICLARKNGRIIALNHAFHGRSLGALSLTHKIAYHLNRSVPRLSMSPS